MRVGVLDVQGDVTEHVMAVQRACDTMGIKADAATVKTPETIKPLSALIIPGGESTTIGGLISTYGLDKAIREVSTEIPILGTCAGLVLMAKEGVSLKNGQSLLGLLDGRVIRNAYGRQAESFEADLDIKALGSRKFHGVFIRAPALEKVWGRCESLAEHEGKIVLARQDNLLVSAFHPELTKDTRLHEYFLQMI